MGDAVKQLSDALERIFRYMLPGACVVLAARLSHPGWFRCLHYDEPWQLGILALIAICAGNVWYVFHRYTLHQLMDWFAYRIWRGRWGGYNRWLIDHMTRSFNFGLRLRSPSPLSPVAFRAAQIIFMFVVCEIVLTTVFWHDECSWFGSIGRNNWFIGCAAGSAMLIALWQYCILFRVDIEIVNTAPIPE